MSAGGSSDASLERLLGLLQAHNPHLMALLQAETEQEFVNAAEGVLERAIRTIEGGAKHYQKLDERGLSAMLADFLNVAGLHATAERTHNGHVDVVVEHAFSRRWKYLGECKMYDGFQYHVEGCKQLLGYCSGRELRAFCLDFFGASGMFDKLKNLRDRMDGERPLEQSVESENHWINGAFLTRHTHATGSEIELLHLGCSIQNV